MTPDSFISELLTMYGPPGTENAARYKQVIRETLEPFGGPELELGCQYVFRNWKYRRWPTPAELRGFCTDAAAALANRQKTAWRAAPQAEDEKVYGNDPYVTEGLVLLARHAAEWSACRGEASKVDLRWRQNAELNDLRTRHGLSGDRFVMPYRPREDEQ